MYTDEESLSRSLILGKMENSKDTIEDDYIRREYSPSI